MRRVAGAVLCCLPFWASGVAAQQQQQPAPAQKCLAQIMLSPNLNIAYGERSRLGFALCRGASDDDAVIGCFQDAIAGGSNHAVS